MTDKERLCIAEFPDAPGTVCGMPESARVHTRCDKANTGRDSCHTFKPDRQLGATQLFPPPSPPVVVYLDAPPEDFPGDLKVVAYVDLHPETIKRIADAVKPKYEGDLADKLVDAVIMNISALGEIRFDRFAAVEKVKALLNAR